MYTRQRGVTFLGWLCLLIPVAIVVYAGIRATPVYLNYVKVARTLEQAVSESKRTSDTLSVQNLRSAIDTRFDIEGVTYPDAKDIQIRRDGQMWVLEAKYEDTAPLFANLSLLFAFDKVVQAGG
jgi:hypothetical protein